MMIELLVSMCMCNVFQFTFRLPSEHSPEHQGDLSAAGTAQDQRQGNTALNCLLIPGSNQVDIPRYRSPESPPPPPKPTITCDSKIYRWVESLAAPVHAE